MSKLWKWFQNCLAVHPLKTQMVSSGLIWGVGDIAAQTITFSTSNRRRNISEREKELKFNWKRVAATSLFGFGFVGPVGHFCYKAGGMFINQKTFGALHKPYMKEMIQFLNCLALCQNNDEKCLRQKELLGTCMEAQGGKKKKPWGSINYHLQRLNKGRK